MNPDSVLVFVATVLPFAAANYGGHSNGLGQGSYIQSGAPMDQLIKTLNGNRGASSGFFQANAPIQALNFNSDHQIPKSFGSIVKNFGRQGSSSGCAHVAGTTGSRFLPLPQGRNSPQVITTKPLPPIVFQQPASPPAHVSSGSAAVIQAAPVRYKLKPSIIFQHEVINKIPTPLTINPVYVKVLQPGNRNNVPAAGHVNTAGFWDAASPSGGSVIANDAGFGVPQFIRQGPTYDAQAAY